MKNIYTLKNTANRVIILMAFSAMLAMAFYSCKKSPTDGVSLIVNSDIIKYSATIQIVDAADSTIVPKNVTLSISGQDADNVYEISGKKSFTLHNGKIQIGINPALIPIKGSPVSFTLEISADGYLPLSQDVQIAAGQLSQSLKITMLNISSPPPGVNLVQQDVDASSGALTADAAVKILDGQAPYTAAAGGPVVNATSPTTIYADNALATVVLPAGTTFYYYKFKKTGTATGTRIIQVPAKKDSTVSITTPPFNSQPITGTGISQFTPPPTTTTYTYRPLVDSIISYQYDLGYLETVAYKGNVHVACEYALPNLTTSNISVFPYNLFKPNPIKMLDNSTVQEDELLYTSALRAIIKDIYFIGTVNGRSIIISPSSDINGNTTRSITWRASNTIDPDIINPYTGAKIKEGDKIDIGIDYKKMKTVQAVVQKVRGQLRVEGRSGNAGFYHKAKNTAVYIFNINATPQSDIPDSYNIRASGSVTCGSVTCAYFSVSPENTMPILYGKVISDATLTSPIMYYSQYYFDSRNFVSVNNFSTASLFSGVPNLYPETTLQVSLTCTGDPDKPITVNPTYRDFLYYHNFASSFACSLLNGTFKTRGLAPGTVISASGWVGGTNITFSTTVKSGINPIAVSFGYKDNLICNTF